MVESDPKKPQAELSSSLQKLMFLRVLFVSILLGASIVIQVRETKTYFGDIQTFHYLLIATLYFLTFIYVILLKIVKDLTQLAYVQLLTDTLFTTAIIYSTGGIESIFSFLYILTILNASMILYRKGGMIIASSGSILYGLLLDLHFYGLIHPIGSPIGQYIEYQRSYIFFSIVVNIAAFYCVAFLSSYLSEQIRKGRVELEAKKEDIIKLEALNEWIIRSITSGLITLDDQNRIILFNPAAEKFFDSPANKMIGKNVVETIPFLKDYIGDHAGALHQDLPRFIDITYQGQGDDSRFIRLSLSPLLLPDGNRKGQILIFQDMTEIKKIEEEMRRVEGLALIGELAAGIAHEIRNPMASISGSIQMLNENPGMDDVNGRLMDIVLREINRLNHLVNDFLLFARPKSTNFHIFELNQVIMDSLELFKNSGKWNQNMKVKTHFDDVIKMESDPEQIKQVLWNIFINAVDEMPDGGILDIHIKEMEMADASHPKQKGVKIVLRDTGKGFNEETLSHLFTPFYTTKTGGAGLGLAIVKRIVEGLKGKVTGENHPDGGAVITVLLPLRINNVYETHS
ncbi:MAG: PAS domain-containing protein [Deltaproteobacteria bacterium]|nr:PAS domain-containing protein [Deltaproteobacteria bacterium]